MAVTYKAGSTATFNFQSNPSVPMPAGLAAGDVMLAFLASAGDVEDATLTGWTRLHWTSQGTGGSAVWLRVAQAGEPSSYTFSNLVTADHAIAVVAYSGADPSAPVDSSAASAPGWSDTIVAPSVTTTVDNARVVVGHLHASFSGDMYPPTPDPTTTVREATPGTSSVSANASVADFVQSAPGATGTKSAVTTTGTVYWTGITVALRPGNEPPNAPTLLGPADGATIDRNATQRFSWQFNDPDAGDTQSAYEIRYRKL